MADAQATGGYGYQDDDVKVSPFSFGLNAGNCFLTKFEWIPNGGQGGVEQEALDIVFTINGTAKNYRKFPVTQGFDKNNQPVTDPNSAEFKEALSDFNATITHILHCFVDKDVVKAAFNRPISSFKEFCTIARTILPQNTPSIPLDIFMQYQWQPSKDKNVTYLEIPKKMKYGKWLCKAMAGKWTAVKKENPDDNDKEALYYTNEQGVKHLFVKNGWFMNSPFAHQKRDSNTSSNSSIPANAAAMATSPATSNANINNPATPAPVNTW